MMKNMPFWGQLLIVTGLGAAVLFLGFRFLLAADYKQIGELRTTLAEKNHA